MSKYAIKNKKYFILALLPSILGFTIFSLVPLINALWISLTSWDIIGGSPEYIGFANYINIFKSGEFLTVLNNTIRFVALYIPLIIIGSIIVSLMYKFDEKNTKIMKVILFLPVLTSWIAGALIWKTVLNSDYGLLNNILSIFGINGPNWLTDSKWAMRSIVLVSLWKDLGYFSLIMYGGLASIDKSLYEAAKVDGADSKTIFRNITLPLLTPTIFLVLITTLINSFQLFPQVMILTGGGPLNSTQVMVERIYTYGFRYYQMGYASALSVILLVIILIVTLIQFALEKRWVTYD